MSVKFDDEKPEAYAWRMNIKTRLEKLAVDIAAMKRDIGILKATSATKSNLAEAKSAIIVWVVGAIFVAQLLPALLKLLTG